MNGHDAEKDGPFGEGVSSIATKRKLLLLSGPR